MVYAYDLQEPLGGRFCAEKRLRIVLLRASRVVAAFSVRVNQHADVSGRIGSMFDMDRCRSITG